MKAAVRLDVSRIAVRRGEIQGARRLLRAAVRDRPECIEALLRLAWLTEDREERAQLLRRVLALEPDHRQARAELARGLGGPAGPNANTERKEGPSRLWILGPLILLAVLSSVALLIWGPIDSGLAWLMPTATPAPTPTPTLTPPQIAAQFEPQLEAALAGGNWARAAEIVDIMRSVDPAGTEWQRRAQATYMQCGQGLVREGQVQAALRLFEEVLVLAPGDQEASDWQQTTRAYLAGERALDTGQWGAAIQAFSDALARMPSFGDVSERLLEAYRRNAEAAIAEEDWDTAVESLLQAQEQSPGDAQVASLLTTAYRGQGEAAVVREDWETAVESLALARDALPSDGALERLLATAYIQRGISRYDSGQLEEARADLEAALTILPENVKAQTYLDTVMSELYPPKRIEIDISKQRLYAWEGENLIHEYATSTGLPGQDTATGHFKVLDKIPMAYSSMWRLKMPHWLGIYYIGTVENGIHALPIRPDGSVMWGGLLGQRQSYGCVILSTEAAQTIYDWAEIGTPVDIHN
jgi:tetratricopeptide (TPR) repeat protein